MWVVISPVLLGLIITVLGMLMATLIKAVFVTSNKQHEILRLREMLTVYDEKDAASDAIARAWEDTKVLYTETHRECHMSEEAISKIAETELVYVDISGKPYRSVVEAAVDAIQAANRMAEHKNHRLEWQYGMYPEAAYGVCKCCTAAVLLNFHPGDRKTGRYTIAADPDCMVYRFPCIKTLV